MYNIIYVYCNIFGRGMKLKRRLSQPINVSNLISYENAIEVPYTQN